MKAHPLGEKGVVVYMQICENKTGKISNNETPLGNIAIIFNYLFLNKYGKERQQKQISILKNEFFYVNNSSICTMASSSVVSSFSERCISMLRF